MREAGGVQMQGGERSVSGNPRNAIDKERTKLRERQRRSITTKIFHGLRKHGGYSLSPRADINEVLRQLAKEAGWIIEPDGTTYRSTSNAFDVCSACGAGKRSGTSTPTSSFLGGGGGGECSTTASPGSLTVTDSMLVFGGPTTSVYYSGISPSSSAIGVCSSPHDLENTLPMYMYGGPSGGLQHPPTAIGTSATLAAYHHHQQRYLKETRASNQNTPLGSPQRHA